MSYELGLNFMRNTRYQKIVQTIRRGVNVQKSEVRPSEEVSAGRVTNLKRLRWGAVVAVLALTGRRAWDLKGLE